MMEVIENLFQMNCGYSAASIRWKYEIGLKKLMCKMAQCTQYSFVASVSSSYSNSRSTWCHRVTVNLTGTTAVQFSGKSCRDMWQFMRTSRWGSSSAFIRLAMLHKMTQMQKYDGEQRRQLRLNKPVDRKENCCKERYTSIKNQRHNQLDWSGSNN